jgi:hypothetical protein|tara:strand:- start:19002 stop:19136 length:135 start_codon:yes stop_codon:yes gene_type:complete
MLRCHASSIKDEGWNTFENGVSRLAVMNLTQVLVDELGAVFVEV